MSTVFVSGASGFVAQHLIKLLLSEGYTVVGSVRSQEKGKLLADRFGTNFKYEVVPDIVAPGAFDQALKNHPQISIFFHTASPLFFPQDDIEKQLITPAVEGTKNALIAAKQHGKNIERFVLTSSNSAIEATPGAGRDRIVNEDTWTEITKEQALQNGFQGYDASKTYAEKAAWEFIKNENPQFKFSTVNPPIIFGPQAFDPAANEPLNTSNGVLEQYLALKPHDPLPFVKGVFVDVRDVARAHLIAATEQNAVGQRLYLGTGPYTPQYIVNLLHKHFPQLTNVPKGDPSEEKASLESAPPAVIDNSRTKKILNFEAIPFEKSLVDTITQLLTRSA